jgi:hypothetical protein
MNNQNRTRAVDSFSGPAAMVGAARHTDVPASHNAIARTATGSTRDCLHRNVARRLDHQDTIRFVDISVGWYWRCRDSTDHWSCLAHRWLSPKTARSWRRHKKPRWTAALSTSANFGANFGISASASISAGTGLSQKSPGRCCIWLFHVADDGLPTVVHVDVLVRPGGSSAKK